MRRFLKDGDRKSLLPVKTKEKESESSYREFMSSLEMPYPPPTPMPSPPKRRHEKEKEREREREREKEKSQRDNVPSAHRTSAASATVSLTSIVPATVPQTHPPTLDELMHGISGLMQKQSEDFDKKIDRIVKEIRDEHKKDLENLNKEMTQKVEKVEAAVQSIDRKIEDQAIVAEMRQKDFAIRIRGIKESVRDNLELEVAAGLAEEMEYTREEVRYEMDKLFRVNSRIAKEKDLPRDLVIYFTKRTFRDQIIRKSFEKKFRIAGQEVIIMRELPPMYIKRKREYRFLAEELRKRKIRFRWEVPDGMSVSFRGAPTRLRSVSEAREFLTGLMIEESLTEQQDISTPVAAEGETSDEERGTAEQLGVGGGKSKSMMMQLRERPGRGGAKK